MPCVLQPCPCSCTARRLKANQYLSQEHEYQLVYVLLSSDISVAGTASDSGNLVLYFGTEIYDSRKLGYADLCCLASERERYISALKLSN